jgi:hypothetical protein
MSPAMPKVLEVAKKEGLTGNIEEDLPKMRDLFSQAVDDGFLESLAQFVGNSRGNSPGASPTVPMKKDKSSSSNGAPKVATKAKPPQANGQKATPTAAPKPSSGSSSTTTNAMAKKSSSTDTKSSDSGVPAPRCASCGKVTTANKGCGGCYKVYYCDATCQRSHWKAHKAVCKSSS